MIRRLAALCLGLSFVPGLAWADPALFVARAPGITAYLLGSIHALKPGTEWQTPAIGRALDAATECWFEVVLPKTPGPDAMAIVIRGLDPERRLPTLLGEADHARLETQAAALNLPGGAGMVDAMRPWLAWMVLEAGAMKAAGLDGQAGVDTTLQDQAREAGKPIIGFETLEQQAGFVADQPEPLMVHLLHDLLAHPQDDKADLGRLARIWLAGDIAGVAHIMNATEQALGPGFADVLLRRRNTAWAERLDGLRGSGKVILVTVGAGHLAGPGNLRDELVRRHFTMERVQP